MVYQPEKEKKKDMPQQREMLFKALMIDEA